MRYDLIVIGGGLAGEKGAAQAAYFGKRVALVERRGLVSTRFPEKRRKVEFNSGQAGLLRRPGRSKMCWPHISPTHRRMPTG